MLRLKSDFFACLNFAIITITLRFHICSARLKMIVCAFSLEQHSLDVKARRLSIEPLLFAFFATSFESA